MTGSSLPDKQWPSATTDTAGGRHWHSWFSGLLIAAALVAAVLHFGELEHFASLVQRARPIWLLVALALQASTYVAVATGWRLVVRSAGYDPPLVSLIRIAITKLFADQAVPTGGMSGNILLVDQLIALGIPRGVASAALIVTIVGYYAAFGACALVTLALLWVNHEASVALTVILTMFLGLALGIPAIALWFGRAASGRLTSHLHRIGWLARISETIAAAPRPLLRNRGLLVRVAACNLAVFVADAATLWVCLHALGIGVAPWKAFIALIMACVVTTLGPIPMGLGSFEATATGILRLVGVQAEAAFAGTMLLRLFTLWLPLLPGLVLVRKLRRHRKTRQENA